jgi:hypothetical protein
MTSTEQDRPSATGSAPGVRIVPVERPGGSVLALPGETADQAVHALDDVPDGRTVLVVPSGWWPREGDVVVLAERALPLEAINWARAEAVELDTAVVVVQPLTGPDTCTPCSTGAGYVATAQQESLDLELATIAQDDPGAEVAMVGEVVWGGLPRGVRRIAPTTALVVVDREALDSPVLRSGVDAALHDTHLPVLIVATR